MRRELRLVKDERVLGFVDDALEPAMSPSVADVLSALVREVGAPETVRQVLADGWSNGYLYFAEATS